MSEIQLPTIRLYDEKRGNGHREEAEMARRDLPTMTPVVSADGTALAFWWPELFIPRNSGRIDSNGVGGGGGIDYEKLAGLIGDRVARALAGVQLSVGVNNIHSALLRKGQRNAGLGF